MSAESSQSYLRVAYDLRPAKQVERRILLDFFRRIAGLGVDIESFQYVGMGSVHFVDHILFHKFLGIDKLVSVERDAEIRKRLEFNRPFDNVALEIMEIGEYVPRLSEDEKHIVWLDYDYRLSSDMIEDVRAFTNRLASESFLLVTVDAEPPKGSDGGEDNLRYYKSVANNHWDPAWGVPDFSNDEIHLRVCDILARAFLEGASGRPREDALPCFKFVYSDSHRMVTMGVQIGGGGDATKLRTLRDQGADYLVLDFGASPFDIDVPVLTRRERLHLEGAMPSASSSRRKAAGISDEDFQKFSKIYRFLPSYAELMLG